jgi:tetratricopeptide (TPR) repeat protein
LWSPQRWRRSWPAACRRGPSPSRRRPSPGRRPLTRTTRPASWRSSERIGRKRSQAALRDPENADLHNYLGFSYRHVGQLDAAFEHYRRALEINPRHRGAHEYVGEAYLIVGNLGKAEEHLAALRRICLLPCEELTDLERAIIAYRARAQPVR